jgi:hypothetical protein
MVRISRNVKLESRNDLYFIPELETAAIENPLYQGTTFDCEDLTDFLSLPNKIL